MISRPTVKLSVQYRQPDDRLPVEAEAVASTSALGSLLNIHGFESW